MFKKLEKNKVTETAQSYTVKTLDVIYRNNMGE